MEIPNDVNALNRRVEAVRVNSKDKKGSGLLVFLLTIMVFVGLFGSIYFYYKYNQVKNNPEVVSQKEVNDVVKSVSKLMILPSEEVPSVATVLDKEKLSNQPFFSNVENGDKLLIFPKAMQAIIYRPGSNKIIKVGPIFIDSAQEGIDTDGTSEETSLNVDTPKDTLKIAYYNGTSIPNLSAQTESVVQLNHANYSTELVTNASKQDYKKNLVIDLSGTHSTEASNLAKLLNAEVVVLPEAEVRPEADILIISGQ